MTTTVCIGGPCHGRAVMVDTAREHIQVEERKRFPLHEPSGRFERPADMEIIVHIYERLEIGSYGHINVVYIHPNEFSAYSETEVAHQVVRSLILCACRGQIPERLS